MSPITSIATCVTTRRWLRDPRSKARFPVQTIVCRVTNRRGDQSSRQGQEQQQEQVQEQEQEQIDYTCLLLLPTAPSAILKPCQQLRAPLSSVFDMLHVAGGAVGLGVCNQKSVGSFLH